MGFAYRDEHPPLRSGLRPGKKNPLTIGHFQYSCFSAVSRRILYIHLISFQNRSVTHAYNLSDGSNNLDFFPEEVQEKDNTSSKLIISYLSI